MTNHGGVRSARLTVIAAAVGIVGFTAFVFTAPSSTTAQAQSSASSQLTSVYTWGDNSYGQLGNSRPDNLLLNGNGNLTDWSSNSSSAFTMTATPIGSNIVGGGDHFLAFTNIGTGSTATKIKAWGGNISGQLGSNDTFHLGRISMGVDNSIPSPVLNSAGGDFKLSTVSSLQTLIAAGNEFSLALDSNNNVWSWGSNLFGQLGHLTPPLTPPVTIPPTPPPPLTVQSRPMQVVGIPTTRLIAAGDSHALAVDSGNNVWTWGKNDSGQLGTVPVGGSSYTPTELPSPCGLDTVSAVSAGMNYSLVLCASSDGTHSLRGFGANDLGQLDSTGSSYSTPTLIPDPCGVPGLNLGTMTEIASGGFHNIAVCSTNQTQTVIAWGANNEGQLGNGSISTGNSLTAPNFPLYSPTVVLRADGTGGFTPLTSNGPIKIAAGYQHSLALLLNEALQPTVDGVYAWGSNSAGQLAVQPAAPPDYAGIRNSPYALKVVFPSLQVMPTEIAATYNTSAATCAC